LVAVADAHYGAEASELVFDWLVEHLEEHRDGLRVWMHHFDWEYFRALKAPWYSGLAQGQGLSLLARIHKHTNAAKYRDAAEQAFAPLLVSTTDGGTLHIDKNQHWWIEEYICDPPTHILNGFIWALWGVLDYEQLTNDKRAADLLAESLRTLDACLEQFDCRYWSRYDLAPTRRPNLASWFYHRLHIVQLDILHRLTGNETFAHCRDKWKTYADNRVCRARAFVGKTLFKLLYF